MKNNLTKRRDSMASHREQIKQKEQAANLSRFVMQTELLKKLLQIEQEYRDNNILAEIASIAEQIGFLSNYKDRPFFQELCKHLYLKTFLPNSFVFKQGDEGDKFYVILNGTVKVLIDQETTLKDVMIKKEVAQLKKGDFFGEMALQYNFKRTATIITTELTDLIILEKEAFQQFMLTDSMQTERVKEVKKFLEKIPIFQDFSDKIMVSLSTKCIQSQHKQQTILLKEGTIPKKLFIIKTGCVKVIQHLPGIHYTNYGPQFEYGFALDEYYELTELSEGDLFGDYQMLKNVKSEYTYMTSIQSNIITLSYFDIKQIVPQEILDQYVIRLQTYPNQKELQELIQEKEKWEKYKQKLTSTIQKDKINRKGFEYGLRLPNLRTKITNPPINHSEIKEYVLSEKRQRLTPLERKLFYNELNYLKQSVSNERFNKFLNH